MEVAEVRLNGVQQKDALFAPLVKARLIDPVLDDTIQHLAHEHGHRVLEQAAADSHQRMSGRKVAGSVESRFRRLHDFSLQDIQRQKKRHQTFASATHQKTTSSILPAESMNDDGILTEFGGMKYDQFDCLCHFSIIYMQPPTH